MRAVERLLALQRRVVAHPAPPRAAGGAVRDARGPPHLLLSLRGAARARGALRAPRLAARADAPRVVLAGLQRLRLRAPLARALRIAAAPQGGPPVAGEPARRTCSRASTRRSSPSASSARSRASPGSCSRASRGSPSRAGRCRPRAASSTRSSRAGTRATRCWGRPSARCWSANWNSRGSRRPCAASSASPVLLRQTHKPTPFAFPLHGGAASREAHQREARRPRAPHAARFRPRGGRGGRGRRRPGGALPVTECVVAGERLVLLPERAAWWPAAKVLFVADFHLGKAASFRSAGIPMPAGTTTENLERLDRALAGRPAAHLVILGDFLHSVAARAERTLERFAQWRAGAPGPRRDAGARQSRRPRRRSAARSGRMRCVDPGERLGPFALVHDPAPVAGAYALAGPHPSGGAALGARRAVGAAALLLVRPLASACCRRSGPSPVPPWCGPARATRSSSSPTTKSSASAECRRDQGVRYFSACHLRRQHTNLTFRSSVSGREGGPRRSGAGRRRCGGPRRSA